MRADQASEFVARLESLPIAAMVFRRDRVAAVNEAAERLLGSAASEILGKSLRGLVGAFVAPEDQEGVASFVASRNEQGHIWFEARLAGAQKSIRAEWKPGSSADQSIVFLLDASGEVASKNVTEGLARSAGELVRCKDESEVLVRAADALLARGFIVTTLLLREGDPLLVYGPMRSPLPRERRYDPGGTEPVRTIRPRREILEELNPGFHKRRAVFFQDLGTAVARAYSPEIAARVRGVLPASRTVQAPLFVDDKPFGALFVTGDLLTPALAGSIEMFAELVARAIETVRLRVELVQRERLAALGEAAAVMAHEVRNPIAAILNAGALLRRFHHDAVGTEADLVRVIAEETGRLNRLVKDLLDLGRPLSPSILPVNLADLAKRTLGVLRDRGAFNGVPIGIEPAPFPVVAAVDADLVQLALGNVILNAVQASPPGGRVTLTLVDQGGSSGISVDDDGRGFPREGAERFLEPFYTTRATGTGIGLAVVRRVVEACAGSIEFAQSPSGGGRVTLLFPRPEPNDGALAG